MIEHPISVKDRLPEEGQKCLWWDSRYKEWQIGTFCTGSGDYTTGYFRGYFNGGITNGVATHWMPMPPNPEVWTTWEDLGKGAKVFTDKTGYSVDDYD